MEDPAPEPPPAPGSPPAEPEPAGLLLSRDVLFTSKVVGTARALGHRFLVAGDVPMASAMIAESRPRVVFVDLSAGQLVTPLVLRALQQAAGPSTTFLAFGAHVDTQALAAARAAGCDPVLPRSRFSAELPALIRHYLGAESSAEGAGDTEKRK